MKKVLFLALIVMFGVILDVGAQTYKYYSTNFSYKAKDKYGYWSDWSEWEESNCLISMSLDRKVISIYSTEIQEFDVYDEIGKSNDDDGRSYTVCCIDKNGLRCNVKFRLQDDGVLQLYVIYNDIIYVYCLEERN